MYKTSTAIFCFAISLPPSIASAEPVACDAFAESFLASEAVASTTDANIHANHLFMCLAESGAIDAVTARTVLASFDMSNETEYEVPDIGTMFVCQPCNNCTGAPLKEFELIAPHDNFQSNSINSP